MNKFIFLDIAWGACNIDPRAVKSLYMMLRPI